LCFISAKSKILFFAIYSNSPCDKPLWLIYSSLNTCSAALT
jgi:hypothetical protein